MYKNTPNERITHAELIKGIPRSALNPDNAFQYFFNEGAGITLNDKQDRVPATAMGGTATHMLDTEKGVLTGSDGITGNNDSYLSIVGNTTIDEILRSDNLTDNESVIIGCAFEISADPAADECIFSWGANATGFYQLNNVGSSIVFTFKDSAGDSFTTSYAQPAQWALGDLIAAVIQINNDTQTYDIYIRGATGVGIRYDDQYGIKNNSIGVGVPPEASGGFCLAARHNFALFQQFFGADTGRTSKMHSFFAARCSGFVNGAKVTEEYFNNHSAQLRSLYDANA